MNYIVKLMCNQDMKLTGEQRQKFDRFVRKIYPCVIAVYLHGSRVKGYSISTSDTDVAVVVDKKHDILRRELEMMSEVGSNLPFSNSDVRVVDESSSKIFLRSIIKDSSVLYKRSELDRIRFEVGAMSKFYDQGYIREIYKYFLYKQIKEDKYDRGQSDLNQALG